MIGKLSYDEMSEFAKSLASSSNNIKSIVQKYDSEQLSKVLDFCDSIDSYSRFLSSSIDLYKDSDDALKVMIEKNK